ncbi:hypothetical protein H8E52_01955 [bacterium]|nr:hypothetical protein [bacterium]
MSKTFKALQRAAEERASKRGGPAADIETPTAPLEAEVQTPVDEAELNAIREESARATEEAKRAALEIQRAEDERHRAALESEKAELLRAEAQRELQKITAAENAAKQAADQAMERERAADEAGLQARAQQDAQEYSRAAAEREREALESVKLAVAEERVAQEAARAAVEKERAALESLKADLEAQRSADETPQLSKESALSSELPMEAEEIEGVAADPFADLPPLEDRKDDPALQKLLQSALVRTSDPRPVKVGPFGRVLGSLDPQRSLALLQRYSLLHCVKEAKDVTLWFWGNGKEARDFADERGLPLDKDALV